MSDVLFVLRTVVADWLDGRLYGNWMCQTLAERLVDNDCFVCCVK